MPQNPTRPLSRHSREAAALLGQLIRRGRRERKITVALLAERAGISRGLVQRIERGDPGCGIGAAFEVAAIVGVRLFDAGPTTISADLAANAAFVALLPQAVRAPKVPVRDDF